MPKIKTGPRFTFVTMADPLETWEEWARVQAARIGTAVDPRLAPREKIERVIDVFIKQFGLEEYRLETPAPVTRIPKFCRGCKETPQKPGARYCHMGILMAKKKYTCAYKKWKGADYE